HRRDPEIPVHPESGGPAQRVTPGFTLPDRSCSEEKNEKNRTRDDRPDGGGKLIVFSAGEGGEKCCEEEGSDTLGRIDRTEKHGSAGASERKLAGITPHKAERARKSVLKSVDVRAISPP